MQNNTINIGGRLIYLSEPIVMAIVNATPDSFYKNSRKQTEIQIANRAQMSLKQGAAIIDVGGYSTRPQAIDIEPQEEYKRISKALKIIKKQTNNIPLSVDTFRASVVEKLYNEHGPFIVNDISGGTIDNAMFSTVACLGLPYVMGHIKGTPQTMNQYAKYDDIMDELITFFVTQLKKARTEGVKDIIIDPCFGFAKKIDHNFTLLKHFDQLSLFGLPLMAGISRKSMIYKTLDVKPDQALTGTIALNWAALKNGARILRVHDVSEATQVIKLFECYEKAR